jgi:hypothetical protein
VPYWKYAVVAAPLGLTVPFNVAPVAEIPVAPLVVTVGKETTSSLVIVTVALLGEPIVYAALVLNATTTVSSLSIAVSLIGVTVITADADPAGIVTPVPMLL